MRIAVLVAVAIHAAVLFLVNPVVLRPTDAMPGNRLDVVLAPGTVATTAPAAEPSHARHPAASHRPARSPSKSPALQVAPAPAARSGNDQGRDQSQQTPVMTAQTEQPPASSGPASPAQAPAGAPGAPQPGGGPAGTQAIERDSAGGNDRAGADDTAAILAYVNRLTRAMRRLPRGKHASPLRRDVRVQIALDHGAPSVKILGSSEVVEFDRLSVASANLALVAVKPPSELFDKRFRFSVCVQFNALDNGEPDRDEVRAGRIGADGVLDLYFEHGVACDTAVDVHEASLEQQGPALPPELSHYRDQLVAEAKHFWFYPGAARPRGEPGEEGVVAVEIVSQGGLPVARATYSAANRYPALNDAAEVIVRRAIAAAGLPPGLQGESFRFEVPIEFRLADP